MGLRSFLRRTLWGSPPEAEAETPEAAASPSRSLPDEPDGDHVAVLFADELRPGEGRTVEARGEMVAVYRVDGGWYAVDDACTHEDGPLGDGWLEDGIVVVCPYHDWRYDLRNGSCLTDASRPIGCFSVREREGVVWVGPRLSESAEDRGGGHDDGLREV